MNAAAASATTGRSASCSPTPGTAPKTTSPLPAQTIGAAFLSPAAALATESQTAAARLASATVATAHGHATLMLDGTFGSGPGAVQAASDQAAAATLALISGRESLNPAATDRRPPGR